MAIFSLTNAEIVRSVLMTAAIGRNAGDMDPATEADVRAIIRAGLRRANFPVVNDYAYQWRWLEKHHPLSIDPLYETGTIAVSGGTITGTGTVFPSWAADGFVAVAGHVLYVDERTSNTVLTTTNTALTVAAGAEFTLYRYRYPLPTDFAEWLGGVVYADGTQSRILADASEPEIRLRYAIGQGLGGQSPVPGWYRGTTHHAITSTPAAAGLFIVLWPVPEPDAFIQGVYLSTPDDNLPADLTVPGVVAQVRPIYSEVFLEAILAAAESYAGDKAGIHEQRFQTALQQAIAHDKASGGAYDFSRSLSDRRRWGHGCGWALPIDFTDAL